MIINKLKVKGGALKDKAKRIYSGKDSVDSLILDVTSHSDSLPDESKTIKIMADLANIHAKDQEDPTQNQMPQYIDLIVKRIHTRDWRTVIKALLLIHAFLRQAAPALVEELCRQSHRFVVPAKDYADDAHTRQAAALSHRFGRYLAIRAGTQREYTRIEQAPIVKYPEARLAWAREAGAETQCDPTATDTIKSNPYTSQPTAALNAIAAEALAIAACECPWSGDRHPLIEAVAERLDQDAQALTAVGTALGLGLVPPTGVADVISESELEESKNLPDFSQTIPTPSQTRSLLAFADGITQLQRWRLLRGEPGPNPSPAVGVLLAYSHTLGRNGQDPACADVGDVCEGPQPSPGTSNLLSDPLVTPQDGEVVGWDEGSPLVGSG